MRQRLKKPQTKNFDIETESTNLYKSFSECNITGHIIVMQCHFIMKQGILCEHVNADFNMAKVWSKQTVTTTEKVL